jgi:hypothetical protein
LRCDSIAGVVNPDPSSLVEGPRQQVEQDLKRYLSQERGLSAATLVDYLPFVRQFLSERFGRGRMQPAKLHAANITGFVQHHARDLSPGRARPYLYTDDEIERLLQAAKSLPSRQGLRS